MIVRIQSLYLGQDMRNIPYWLNIGSILYQYGCATRVGITITKYIIVHKLTAVVRILIGSTLAVVLAVTELVFRNAMIVSDARTSFLTARTTIVLHGNISAIHYQIYT